MQINLSSETLDHLAYHLGALAKHYAKAAAAARTSGPRERARGHLAEVHDLLAIFSDEDAPVLPRPHVDVIATDQGSVFHFALQSAGAVGFVRDTFATESWQWLGDRAIGIDHRFAPQVVCQLRDAGFVVEVR